MALPPGTVLAAAPGIITAAADIIKVIRDRKKQAPEAETDKLGELANNNRNTALAVKNNRRFSAVAIGIAVFACVFLVAG